MKAIRLAPPGETIDHPYPTPTKDSHHEVELVAALGKGGRDVPFVRGDIMDAHIDGLPELRVKVV
jgi:fumarylpyruvate hydrolase